MSADLTHQAIELLVKRRWPMIPSRGDSKGACVEWKRFQEQLPTVEELREWDQRLKPERWGLVTGKLSGVVVLDFDGEMGIELMRKWGIDPHVRTGSGGFHWYLLHPSWRVPTLNAKSGKKSWPWPGLDIRGDGGFAVLLGRNKNGPYEQLRDLVPDPFDALPEEVRAFLRNHSEKADAKPQQSARNHRTTPGSGRRVDTERLIRNALEIVPNRGRNNSGFWLACQLRDNEFSNGDAEAAMRDYRSRVPSTNAKGQREPYIEREMLASLHEAYSRPAREPWVRCTPPPKDGSAPAAAPSQGQGPPPDDEAPARNEKAPDGNDADGSRSIYLYVGHTGEPLVGHTGEPLSRNQFSRVPCEVSADRRLKARDVRVYGVLAASCWQGSVANVGKRRIAKLACCAERLVISSLKRLEATGHIQKLPVHRGERGRYLLPSSVFGQKQRADIEEIVMAPDGQPRLATVRKDQGTAWTSRALQMKRPERTKGRR
jgi:hypothetical protein